jgi:hypothetical protein
LCKPPSNSSSYSTGWRWLHATTNCWVALAAYNLQHTTQHTSCWVALAAGASTVATDAQLTCLPIVVLGIWLHFLGPGAADWWCSWLVHDGSCMQAIMLLLPAVLQPLNLRGAWGLLCALSSEGCILELCILLIVSASVVEAICLDPNTQLITEETLPPLRDRARCM